MAERLSWDDYFLAIARTVAVRADCTRRSVGAVIVRGNRVVATGYNGAPSGEPGCLSAGACPRGRHYRHPLGSASPTCKCGNEWPCHLAVEPSSSYDTELGSCIAVHAEQNAIIQVGLAGCIGSTLYCTDKPCMGCDRLIEAAQIARVVYGK